MKIANKDIEKRLNEALENNNNLTEQLNENILESYVLDVPRHLVKHVLIYGRF